MIVNQVLQGDVLARLKEIPDECVNTIITSPPYWGLRDYGVDGQLGLEPSLNEYLDKLLLVTKELYRVLRVDGVLFWNHGDCYGGSMQGHGQTRVSTGFQNVMDLPQYPGNHMIPPAATLTPKCMALQNYRLLLRMVDSQGWILRNILVWHKTNHMPSSVRDRFANSYEPVYMLVKSKKYWFDLDAVRKPLKYPDDVARRIRQDAQDNINPFAKDSKTVAWRRGLVKGDVNVGPEQFHSSNVQLNPLGGNPGDVWSLSTQPFSEAHFATFPEKLVEPMIKSACPEWVCERCGKAKVRITKTDYDVQNEVGAKINLLSEKTISKQNFELKAKSDDDLVGNRPQSFKHGRANAIRNTIGWSVCGCGAGFKPGIVLDPFFGAGTTGLVALKLNRSFVGIELNPAYIEIANRRLKPYLEQTKLTECALMVGVPAMKGDCL